MPATITATHRERLQSIRTRARDARERRSRCRDAYDAAMQAGDQDAAAVARLALDDVSLDVDTAEQLERVMLHQLSGVDSGLGVSFLDDPTTVGQLEQLAHSTLPIGNVSLGPAMSAEELVGRIESGNWGPTPKMAAAGEVTLPAGTPARDGAYGGVVPQLRRPLRLLDLIPSAPGDGSGFDYLAESGSLDTAVETAEGAVKPGAEAIFTDAEVRFRTIPHWTKVNRPALADVPGLQAVIENRLIYGVLRRVENQIIAGTGVGENLRGILNTSGIASVAFDAGVPLAELPLRGFRDVILGDAVPTAAVVSVADWITMLVAKTPGGDYYGDGPFSAQQPTLWGLPAIPSKVLSAGTAIVGDWSQAMLFVREGANVRISDSDQDDFIRNRVTLLGEGRFGLAVWQPGAFATIDLAA